MSSEEEIDDFDLKDHELAAALGFTKRKKRTKNSMIYGIWNDESDDEAPSIDRSKKKDYSAPITFVIGGSKAGTKVEGLDDIQSSDDDMDALDPNDPKYESIYLAKKQNKEDEKMLESTVKSEPAKVEPSPSVLKLGGATKAKGGYSMAPLGAKERADKGFAKFAKGSFAEKMMKKMGWNEGKGLGKFSQGMINPVDVKQRKKGSGLGSHGTERTKQSLIHFPTPEVREKQKEKEERKAVKGPQWKADKNTKHKKPKYVFKTVDDLKNSGGYGVESDEEIPESKPEFKIVDMTGKEKRVITDVRQMPSQKARSRKRSDGSGSSSEDSSSEDEVEKVWNCTALEHNLETLVKNAKKEILKYQRQRQEQDNRKHHYQYEQSRNQKQIISDAKSVDILEGVLNLLAEETKSLDEAFNIANKLRYDYSEQWEQFFLEVEMANNIVRPLLCTYLSTWNPLQEPEAVCQELVRWRTILPGYYDALLWTCWMPPVRRQILKWEPREPDIMIEFISIWRSEITTTAWENIINQLILPKLNSAVTQWDPYREKIRIDEWLLPWLSIIGKTKMFEMISSIRSELKQCLRRWTASDSSAKIILSPWKSIWSPAEWDHFMVQNIVPKLEDCMGSIVINISKINSSQINWIQDWIGLVPIQSIIRLYDEIFFRKWTVALKTWLNSPNCKLSDVAGWYRGWYAIWHKEIKNAGVVRDHLSQCLQLMKSVCNEKVHTIPVRTHDIPPPPSPPSMVISDDEMDTDETEPIKPPTFQSKPEFDTVGGAPVTFKDLIERRAGQRNLVFMPKGKQYLGKDIYICGKLDLYMEKGVCFVSNKQGDWVPMSITKLFDKAWKP